MRTAFPDYASAPSGLQYSHPHRHQHVERALGIAILDQGRRARIGEAEHRRVALDLSRDVEQVARVEADIEWLRAVLDLDFLRGAAGIRIGDRKHELAVGERELDGTAALTRHRGNAIDRLLELLL